MREQSNRESGKGQSVLEQRAEFQFAMAKVGFVAGTQTVYLRAFDAFAKRLDRKTPASATRKEARRYLTELKQAGASANVYSHAAAALRFFFEAVRGMEWKPVSALQKRMIEDMQLRGFSSRTQDSYVRSVLGLAVFYNRSPDLLDTEELRRYFVHLTCERKLARPTVTIALCGIKFFYVHTLKRDWSLTGVPVPKRKKFLPVILSRKEVRTILSKIRIVRHSACLGLTYACGLRLSEACSVKISDIDRDRGLLHVHGKGSKDRYVPLPSAIMPLLEKCWDSHQNATWLFPWVGRGREGGRVRGTFSDRHVPKGTIQQVFRKALLESGVSKKVSVHSLRHAYATHLLEANVTLGQIQEWLGHSSPTTTSLYAHLTEHSTRAAGKILDALMDDISDLSD
jgi:integrase/recombinase XerD